MRRSSCQRSRASTSSENNSGDSISSEDGIKIFNMNKKADSVKSKTSSRQNAINEYSSIVKGRRSSKNICSDDKVDENSTAAELSVKILIRSLRNTTMRILLTALLLLICANVFSKQKQTSSPVKPDSIDNSIIVQVDSALNQHKIQTSYSHSGLRSNSCPDMPSPFTCVSDSAVTTIQTASMWTVSSCKAKYSNLYRLSATSTATQSFCTNQMLTLPTSEPQLSTALAAKSLNDAIPPKEEIMSCACCKTLVKTDCFCNQTESLKAFSTNEIISSVPILVAMWAHKGAYLRSGRRLGATFGCSNPVNGASYTKLYRYDTNMPNPQQNLCLPAAYGICKNFKEKYGTTETSGSVKWAQHACLEFSLLQFRTGASLKQHVTNMSSICNDFCTNAAAPYTTGDCAANWVIPKLYCYDDQIPADDPSTADVNEAQDFRNSHARGVGFDTLPKHTDLDFDNSGTPIAGAIDLSNATTFFASATNVDAAAERWAKAADSTMYEAGWKSYQSQLTPEERKRQNPGEGLTPSNKQEQPSCFGGGGAGCAGAIGAVAAAIVIGIIVYCTCGQKTEGDGGVFGGVVKGGGINIVIIVVGVLVFILMVVGITLRKMHVAKKEKEEGW